MENKEPEDKVTASGQVHLPAGMTQEEAERLIREADELAKENG